jgi:L-Ala-D/L-Glu epimerase
LVCGVKLEYRGVNLELAHTWNISRTRGLKCCPVVIARLTDTEGTVGWGEASPVARYNESVKTVERFLRQVDPDRLSFGSIPGSLHYLNSLSSQDRSARCALDVALHDGAARRAGKPLHQLLGLRFREHHHLTSFTIGIDTPDVIREKVRAAAEYPVLKLKMGVPGDRENLRALREVAPTKPVRVDVNEGWRTREQALRMMEWLARDGHVEFVEQPLPASTPASTWRWLKRRAPLPVFGDESFHLGADAEQAAECFHGVNVKLVKTGGISAAVAALQAARRAGLRTMLGCMIETSLLISAGAHLAALCNHLDLDGNLLIRNDPFRGVTARCGVLSFAAAPEPFGLQVRQRRGRAGL